MYTATLLLTIVACVQSSTFNNPILSDKYYTYAGAIKVDGTYYVVSRTPDISNGVFPIHSSTDLINWNDEGYVFDVSILPKWTKIDSCYYPVIHKIGDNFLLYFGARNLSSSYDSVGVAISSHPLGPYTPVDRADLTQPKKNIYHPTIINDDGTLYLIWTSSIVSGMYARQLTPDGLSFASDKVITLMNPSLPWESSYLAAPWHYHRGSYHYILYSGGLCRVGVARSRNALGPYEKLPNPIIDENDVYKCTENACLVNDNDKNDVIFFNARRKDDENRQNLVLLASVSWDAQEWPDVGDF